MDEAYIGVDVGTGSARAGVFDGAGRLLAKRQKADRDLARGGRASSSNPRRTSGARRPAPCARRSSPAACRNRISPASDSTRPVRWWCSTPRARRCPSARAAIAQRDVIVWMDHRATGEADRINAGGHEVLRHVGGKISPEMQVPKLLWLARHMPQTFARAGHFFDLTDFLTWRASGATHAPSAR